MWAELHELSDAELVDAVRRGESEAFDVLFRRHYAGACDYAARLAGVDRAPDRAAEGFSRVYRILLKGQGPDTNFRGYLYTAVRNAHVDAVRRGGSEVPVEDLGSDLSSPDDVEDDVLSRLDATPIRRAFAQLRPAWRNVLWHTAVLGESHEQVARRLDSNPNAIAVLSFRAREGLRHAYLAEHLSSSADKACGRVATHLPGHVRGTLTPRRERMVGEHLESCRACRAAVADLARINDDLGAILTPAVLLAMPGLVGGATMKGLVAGVLTRVSDLVKGPAGVAGAAGVAVAATVAVAVGMALTGGSEPERPRAGAPQPSGHIEPARPSVPPPAAPADRPESDPPPAQTASPTGAPVPVVPVAASGPPAPPDPPVGTAPPPPTANPSAPSPSPSPSPHSSPSPWSVTEERATVIGSDRLRHAMVLFDITPGAADGIVVTVSNVRGLVVTSSGALCPPAWPPGGEAVVQCTIAAAHQSTFPLALHVTFADAAEPVSGSVELTGISEPVATDFAVTP